jgi:hypothetical protein
MVAPEGFQTHQVFMPHTASELSWAFEATLVLAAGRFHRLAASRFSRSPWGGTVQTLAMVFPMRDSRSNGASLLLAQSPGQGVQVLERRRDSPLLELLEHRFDPGPCGRLILRAQRVRHRPQALAGVRAISDKHAGQDARICIPVMKTFATMKSNLGAGFYSHLWGPLPFAFGKPDDGKYLIYRMIVPGQLHS